MGGRWIVRLGAGALLFALGGCSPAPRESTGTEGEAILGGSVASAYPEGALVDLYAKGQLIAACSGALIAPLVVLTAGHCVTGEPAAVPDGWKVTAPYAPSKQAVKVSSSAVYDWMGGSSTIVPTQHDIGLLFLAAPIMLSSYPAIAQTELPDGTQVVNIGRINNGALSMTDLYVSPEVAVSDGSEASPPFPYDYSAMDVIESGDSGGPDEVVGMTAHLIVAVNSGEGGGNEVLARTDPVTSWIQTELQMHLTAPAIDAGIDAPVDAAPGPEAGASPPDATIDTDGALPTIAFPRTGDGCSVGGRGRGLAPLGWLGLVGLALLQRRRRRRN
jgi:MYXO-CTERM domain-containing protein